ncbi:Dihydropteroate synthase [Nitrosomonas cryotolerans]|uniref:dihydropteroate synthase n=1 Tax=Nitrosomonas cryotolerans ATCC 49181 TaxID=1131553 RepID=A0A1N6GE34_9PROT|nr:dihydropteroate synthase [Nitrosomonas cryotolerans]SFP88423.1 Dihydropteroate synthase [Nitrosomonas cryotolerans]SIO05737.1 Dihydropteroate synthase [Nitrosomonas cryotolerans ATCC 49181]
MGVINITPDSFSDGGRYVSTKQAIIHAKCLIEEGADILDIGGESTRPGSQSITVAEELSRVIPVIEALTGTDIPISIDTSKPEVMKHAIESGVSMINDINALRTPGAVEAIAQTNVFISLMHMQGQPHSMQKDPQYTHVVTEVMNFLRQRLSVVQNAGISRDRLLIDPGFGFGKSLQHNLELLRHLDDFMSIGVPILVGLSRKSMLGAITGNEVGQRIHESVAAALLAVIKGAKIVRVHDVKATRAALAVYTALND